MNRDNGESGEAHSDGSSSEALGFTMSEERTGRGAGWAEMDTAVVLLREGQAVQLRTHIAWHRPRWL